MSSGSGSIAIVGTSLTALLVARRLCAEGRSVTVHPYGPDNGDVSSFYRVPANPIRDHAVAGNEIDDALVSHLSARGAWPAMQVTRIRVGTSGVELRGADSLLDVDRALLAPYGTEMGAPELGADALGRRAISKDAASDAAVLRGRPAGVLGSGMRAAEQALIAHDAGMSPITILCESDRPSFGGLAEDIDRRADIRVLTGITALRLESPAPLTCVIHFLHGGRAERLETSYLFLARGLVADLTRIEISSEAVGSETRLLLGGTAGGFRHGTTRRKWMTSNGCLQH